MWPLLAVSVVATAVSLERAVHYLRQRAAFEPFVEGLCRLLRAGDLASARALASAGRHPAARMALAFLDLIPRPRGLRGELLQREGGRVLEEVERRLPWLRLAVQIAPILGLLGTVHGLLLAFWKLEAIAGPIRPSDLAGGIGSALTTTVFGLLIAIPASACLSCFEEHAERVARRLGFVVSHLEEALLDAPPKPGARGEG